jgi:hypothetical protein
MPKTLTDLAASLVAYLGYISTLYLLFANYEKLQENYIITVTFIVAIVVVFLSFVVVFLSLQLKDFGDRFLVAYSSKDTITSARRHSAAVATGVIESINEEGQSGPLCWLLWLPFRIFKRTADVIQGPNSNAN